MGSAREGFLPPTRSHLVLSACTIDFVRGQAVHRDGRVERLSPRETELVAWLADHADRILSRDELFGRIWGGSTHVVSRVVDTAVRRLRRKIEADPQRPDHLLTAFGEGYRFVAAVRTAEAAPEVPDGDPFVGREEECAHLIAVLRRGPATVLIHGPPGVGKTRLAGRIARQLRRELRGGSLLVDVTETRDLPQVAQAVASALALDVPEGGAAAVRRVGEALRARGPCLLMLDNCEGVSEPVAAVLVAWRAAAPEARLLATSRERLSGVDDVIALGPMTRDDAVALFETLARRMRPSFRSSDAQPVVEALVERLERLPLAIALAAGRAGALSPRAILERLDDRFRLLASRTPGRQHTLRAALDSSWELLGEAERAAFLACSAFRGGFDVEAAQAVIGPDAAGLLASLSARSLLEPRGQRFGGYAFVREYATERLTEDPVTEAAVHRRHAAWFAERCRTSTGRRALAKLSADRANLVAATERAAASGQAEIAALTGQGVLEIVEREGPYELGLEIGDVVLGIPDLAVHDRVGLELRLAALEQWSGIGDPVARIDRAERLAVGDRGLVARALRTRGTIVRMRGSPEDSVPFLLESIALARVAPVQHRTLCGALGDLSQSYRETGRTPLAIACLEEILTLADTVPEVADWAASAFRNLAMIQRRLGRHAVARELYERALALQLAEDDRRGAAMVRAGLGNLHLELGDWTAASAEYAHALEVAREIGAVELEARMLGNLGICAGGVGDPDRARGYLEAAVDAFGRLGEPRHAALARGNLANVELTIGNHAYAAQVLAVAVGELRRFGDVDSAAELAGSWAEALLHLGDAAAARGIVDEAEREARAVQNPLVLAQVLARRGLVERAEGRDARGTLVEAEALATGAGPQSEAARVIGLLRAALAGS